MQTGWLYLLQNRSSGRTKFTSQEQAFCSCDLDLDLHIQTKSLLPGITADVEIWTSYVKTFESYHLTDRQSINQVKYLEWPK